MAGEFEEADRIGIGERIKAARNAALMSQSALARMLGLTRSSVANVEAGRQAVTAHALIGYARALGADAGWLLTGRQHPNRPQPPVHPAYVDRVRAVAADLDAIGAYLKDAGRRIKPER